MLSAVREGSLLLVDAGGASDFALTELRREVGAGLVHATLMADALVQARSSQFALILLAVSGHSHDEAPDRVLQLQRNLRSHQTPIIVLAASAGPSFPLQQCYEAGAVDVLTGAVPRVALFSKIKFFIDAAHSANERRRVESMLKDTRASFDTTVAAAELAMWAWDLQANRVTADPTMQRLFGVSDSDADGGLPQAYFAAVHPHDLAHNRQMIELAIGSGAPCESRMRVRSADGHHRTVVARGQVSFDGAGKPIRMRGVVIDVSRQAEAEQELRDSEERYRVLFESIDEGICIVEMLYDQHGAPCDYRFLEMNAAFGKHTGLHDAVGKTILEIVPNHDRHWFTTYGNVVSSGEPLRFIDEAVAMKRWFDVYATRVGGTNSRKLAIVFSDITERKRAETELQRLADDLSEADRRKTAFLATLAHELRNPLAPLRSGLQVLRMGGDQATAARVQNVMERQLNHMVELVDDLLDVARITRGQVELKRAKVNLADLIASAVEISTPLIEASAHALHVSLPELPLTLDADPTRIIQILSNLLNNAVKYTARAGRIGIDAHADGATAIITVSDNGIGIAPTLLDAIFETFTQAGRDGTRVDGGLGIGLALARSLAELHGGSVRAVSAGTGHGSKFMLRLPLAAMQEQPVPEANVSATDAHMQSKRVLVVDDNFDAADTLAALLNLLGHEAMVANNGPQALRALPEFKPQLVFCDIGMPGMDGYEVARQIRSQSAFDHIRLVALTGWGGESDRARSRAAGFDLHLTKPGSLAAIEAILASPPAPAPDAP